VFAAGALPQLLPGPFLPRPLPQAPSNQCQTLTDSSLPIPTTRLSPRFHLPSRLVYDIATQIAMIIDRDFLPRHIPYMTKQYWKQSSYWKYLRFFIISTVIRCGSEISPYFASLLPARFSRRIIWLFLCDLCTVTNKGAHMINRTNAKTELSCYMSACKLTIPSNIRFTPSALQQRWLVAQTAYSLWKYTEMWNADDNSTGDMTVMTLIHMYNCT